jgi:hypothetical protein
VEVLRRCLPAAMLLSLLEPVDGAQEALGLMDGVTPELTPVGLGLNGELWWDASMSCKCKTPAAKDAAASKVKVGQLRCLPPCWCASLTRFPFPRACVCSRPFTLCVCMCVCVFVYQRVWFGVNGAPSVTPPSCRWQWSALWKQLPITTYSPVLQWHTRSYDELKSSLQSAVLGLDSQRRLARRLMASADGGRYVAKERLIVTMLSS